MPNVLGIALLIVGGLCELSGVLCLTQPQLKFTVPKLVALALLGLGGVLTAVGIMTLAR